MEAQNSKVPTYFKVDIMHYLTERLTKIIAEIQRCSIDNTTHRNKGKNAQNINQSKLNTYMISYLEQGNREEKSFTQQHVECYPLLKARTSNSF